MARDRERYTWEDKELPEARRFARKAGLSVMGWIVVIVAFALLLGGIVWGLQVLTSGPKGAGDAQRITNDGRNRVNAQEMFHDLYQEVRSLDARITETGAQLAAAKTPADRNFYTQTINGQKSRCLEVAGNYNAEARKVSRGLWRDITLPYEIDVTDPATDCKPSGVPTP